MRSGPGGRGARVGGAARLWVLPGVRPGGCRLL